jgi:hypothetical protein
MLRVETGTRLVLASRKFHDIPGEFPTRIRLLSEKNLCVLAPLRELFRSLPTMTKHNLQPFSCLSHLSWFLSPIHYLPRPKTDIEIRSSDAKTYTSSLTIRRTPPRKHEKTQGGKTCGADVLPILHGRNPPPKCPLRQNTRSMKYPQSKHPYRPFVASLHQRHPSATPLLC